MNRLLVLLAAVPAALWAAFALPELLDANPDFWGWRRGLIFLSGTLALWWMSTGMLLAARPAWLEERLNGLDKLYRLHKNIGIGAGIIVFTHWMLEWLPKNLAKLGWIERGGRGPRGPRGQPDFWIDLAKDVGEWAGYILLALVVLALIKRIPYRYFRLVHKAFPLVFLAGAFHGLILMPGSYWQSPLGWLTATVAAVGFIPAMLSLTNRIGSRRQVTARIESLRHFPGGVLEVACRVGSDWPGHRSGQFALVKFGHAGEGAHPFTISSNWNSTTGDVVLAIKALGDYTQTLAGRLRVGETVQLEGPYGRFNFAASGAQVWVAGGIGITPFLARLREMAKPGGAARQPVDLFYCTPGSQPHDFPDDLAGLCRAAGVRLHRRVTDITGSLQPTEVQACLQPGSSVWFCGPAAWGEALGKTLLHGGLPAGAFHRELFEFR